MRNIRTRIAPSPTGYPHIGTIYQALLNRVYAHKYNGQFIVRIEDTDQSRLVVDAEEKLYQALDWFGLTEDEGVRKGGSYTPYKQSQRLDIYQKYIQQLLDQGDAYHCFCSSERLQIIRKQMQKSGQPPMYDRHCRNLSKNEVQKRIKNGEKYVIRLKVPDNKQIIVKDLIRGDIEFSSSVVDDQVLIKSDGFPTYHFAVVVDDHLMQISHIVRGEEWLPSSPKHVLLYQMFNWDIPVWIHTPTLRNPNKSKLSKRQGHTNVTWYQEQGFLPEAVINFLSQLGWTHPDEREIFTQEEFTKLFEFVDLSPAGPVFDEIKLRWMNGKYIREVLSDVKLLKNLKDFIKDYADVYNMDNKYIGILLSKLDSLLPLIKDRLEVLSDIFELTKFIKTDLQINKKLVLKQNKQGEIETLRLISVVCKQFEKLSHWNSKGIEQVIRGTKPDFINWKAREFFMTLRVATTGYPVTPPLFESIEVLGKDETIRRLKSVVVTE